MFELRKLPVTSNASHSIHKFYNWWGLKNKFKSLSLYKKWNSGRNDSGRVVTWTKSSLLNKTKTVKINYHFRYNRLGFISSFQLIPFRNKLLSLVYFANGSVTYFASSTSHKFFAYTYLNTSKKIRKFLFKPLFFMLCQVKKLTFVSFVELTPGKGSQYARSCGVSCKLIRFDKSTHSVLVQLPSTVKKLFSYYSFASLGNVALPNNLKCDNTKSGYWRSFGVKSKVRGVAMNPIDHPHGGRTKTIKYPRTPWGKTTKYK